MSAPFEQKPTFREYLKWGRSVGFTDRACVTGDFVAFVQITTPDGRIIPVTHIRLDERLWPEKISWLNRRTGVICPWAGMPELTPPAANSPSTSG